MSNRVRVGEREFVIGPPTPKLYIKTLRWLLALVKAGTEQAEAIAKEAGKEDSTNFDMALALLDNLEEEQLYQLSALLLQFRDIDEGVAFIKEAGWNLSWFSEVLAITAEQLDLKAAVQNFRRMWRAMQTEEKAKAKAEA